MMNRDELNELADKLIASANRDEFMDKLHEAIRFANHEAIRQFVSETEAEYRTRFTTSHKDAFRSILRQRMRDAGILK